MRHDLPVPHSSMARWRCLFAGITHSDRGATAVEYGLIGALIAVAILMVVVVVGF